MRTRNTSLTTDQKALAVNLDKYKYGSIVEIGAGQEVARRFFQVGAAAGTVAKTMSAYDMAVSDDIYGHVDRYVSRARHSQWCCTGKSTRSAPRMKASPATTPPWPSSTPHSR